MSRGNLPAGISPRLGRFASRLLALGPSILIAGSMVLTASAESPRQKARGDAPEAVDSAEVAEKLIAQGERVTLEGLLELARIGDQSAYDGTVLIARTLSTPDRVADAYRALGEFAGTEHEASTIALLARVGHGGAHSPATRPAVRTLVRFRQRAVEELEGIARDGEDPGARAMAVGGLSMVYRTRFVKAGDTDGAMGDFEFVLRGFRTPASGTLELGASLLASYEAAAAWKLLRRTMRDGKLPDSLRGLAAAALAWAPDDEVVGWTRAALDPGEPHLALAVLETLLARGKLPETRVLTRLERSEDDRLAFRAGEVLNGLLIDELGPLDALTAAESVVRPAESVAAVALASSARKLGVRLERMAKSTRPAHRATAAQALGQLGGALGPDLEALYLETVADKDVAVRIAALPWLRDRRTPATVALLIERYGVETQRLRADLRDLLIDLTARDHGPSPQRWAAFWEAEAEGFVVPSIETVQAFRDGLASARAAGASKVLFFGIDVGSDRVAFVLDVSGSMDAGHGPGGSTRLDAVKAQLARLLASYPETGMFNVHAFSDGVRSFRGRSTEADERSREEALRWVKGRRAKGGTNLSPALLKALDDRAIDTVVVLTDGAIGFSPDGVLLEEVAKRTALRDVIIHGLSMGGRSELLDLLAERTGGDSRVLMR